jgi:hypothetical protein
MQRGGEGVFDEAYRTGLLAAIGKQHDATQ